MKNNFLVVCLICYIVLLHVVLIRCNKTIISPAIVSEFNQSTTHLSLRGQLEYENNDMIRFIKAAELYCDFSLNRCSLITATLVNNGKLPPSLYPTDEEFEIIKKTPSSILASNGDASTLSINIAAKKMILSKGNMISYLKWNN